jgi:hypothetical protein
VSKMAKKNVYQMNVDYFSIKISTLLSKTLNYFIQEKFMGLGKKRQKYCSIEVETGQE